MSEVKTKLLEETGATLDTFGGWTPVQGEGIVDGFHFYFRSRGTHWSFHVAERYGAVLVNDIFCHEEEYGEWPSAGYITDDEALKFMKKGIALFRSSRSTT